jgi:calpain-15
LYCVWLCHDGEFVQILLDDYFPCYVNGGPVFSKSVGNELWVILLEKAYAKCYGTYLKLIRGWACEAMKDLTGAPYEYFSDKNKSADRYWNKILSN